MVYFGTGRYYKADDNLVGSQRQSFYAVPDMGAGGTPVVLSDLLEKTMTTVYTTGLESRSISSTNPDWTNELGWYINLDYDANLRNERIITKVLLLQDKLLITTLSPTATPCDVGGKSWFMEIPAIGDKYIGKHVAKYETKFENQIYLGDTSLSINPIGAAATSSAGSSSSSSAGSSSSSSSSSSSVPSSCGKTTNLSLINSGTSGGALTVNSGALDACGTGRQSWRQLR
jgi:type IV pilus assembly protein PilY1